MIINRRAGKGEIVSFNINFKMTTTTVRVNLQYELEDYNVFTKKKPVIVDMQSVRFGLYYEYLLDLIVN